MDKAYEITGIKFEGDHLILFVDNQVLKIKLSEVSDKLAGATRHQREDYRISPSGYGIHWNLLDEDLSVNGLLKSGRKKSGNKMVEC
jgi:hypothetical protein